MTPSAVAAVLAEVGLPPASLHDPEAALRELEARADDDPADRALARGVLALGEWLAILARRPAGADVAVVRWDELSVTTLERDKRGLPLFVRALRPDAGPAFRRQLLRDGRALAAVLPVELGDDRLSLPAAGQRVSPRRAGALARPLITGLAALSRWEAAGFGAPELGPEELRMDPERGDVHVACLTPGEGGVTAAVGALAARLVDRADESPLGGVARALALHPPERVDDALGELRLALAEALVAQRHTLVAGWRQTWQAGRELRLRGAVARLGELVGPPTGVGAVGVDLDGRITRVAAEGRRVVWSPVDGVPEVVHDAAGFRPPAARRLLRARAVSPPNASLDARIGGEPGYTDALCRWVAAGLRLRTVQLLLDRDRG